MQLWIVGRALGPPGAWEFQGVFDDEDHAKDECVDGACFVGPCELNQSIAKESVPWPGAYYPLAKTQEA